MAFLSDYVESHFSHEETHMQTTQYPGFAGHKAIHDDMRLQVANLVAETEKDAGSLTEDVVNFLTNWLLHHINDEDRLMARHLRLAFEQDTGTEG
jgi:hemerythrin